MLIREVQMYKYVIAAIVGLMLMGCQERYRYPCQDPKNHGNPACKKEVCELSKTCVNQGNQLWKKE